MTAPNQDEPATSFFVVALVETGTDTTAKMANTFTLFIWSDVKKEARLFVNIVESGALDTLGIGIEEDDFFDIENRLE